LQAYIFVILGVNYLAIAVNSVHDHDLTEGSIPETMGAAAPGEPKDKYKNACPLAVEQSDLLGRRYLDFDRDGVKNVS